MTHTHPPIKRISDIQPGDHLCCIYSTEEEHRAVITPFLRAGLEQNEKVFYIVDARTRDVVINYLKNDGVDIDYYLNKGQFTILTIADAYMKGGVFDPDGMIALLTSETQKALDEGYSALRVTGEMSWALRSLPGSERLIEYENKLNTFLPGSRCLAICQYDRRRFDAGILLDILLTHPYAFIGANLYDNFYYTPPEEILKPNRSEMILNRWITNIMHRKETEEALKESENRFRELFSNMSSGVAVYEAVDNGADFVFRDFNCAAETIEKIKKEDVIGRRISEVFPGVREFGLLDVFSRVWRTGQPEHHPISQYKDERIVGWRENFVYRLPSGEIVAVYDDITERKRSEEALRVVHEKYTKAFLSAPDAITISELDSGRFFEVNEAATAIFGYSREELIGKSALELGIWQKKEDRAAFVEQIREHGRVVQYEVVERRKSGELFNAMVNADTISIGKQNYLIAIIRDITDRKQTEDALKKSQIQLIVAMNLAHLANWEFDVPTGIFTFDDRFYALYGTTAEREGGNKMPAEVYAREFVHPDDHDVVADEVNKAINTTDPQYVSQVEHRIIRRNGEVRHLVVRIGITKDSQGRTIKTHGVNQDITDRKRAEIEIQNSRNFLNSIIEQSPNPMWISDEKGTLIQLNKACCDMLQITPEEVVGRYNVLEDNIVEEQGMMPLVRSVFEEGRSVNFDLRYDTTLLKSLILERSAYVILNVTIFPVRDTTGKITNAVIQHVNITERKRAEEVLRESELDLKEAQRVGHLGSWDLNVVTGDLQWSDECFRIYGFRPQEFVPTYEKFRSVVHPEDLGFVQEQVDAALNNDKHYDVDFRFVKPDGETGWIHCEGEVTRDAEGKPLRFFGTQVDITNRKMMEEEIRSLNKALEQRVEQRTAQLNVSLHDKEVLLREVHHRVKNNLQIIISLLNLQSRYITDEMTLAAIRESQNRVKAMALVHEKLYQSADLSWINLDDYVRFLGNSLFQFYGMKGKGITFTTTIPEVTLDINTAIPVGLITNELVSNSLKYAFPDGRTGEISISIKREDHIITILFKDNGVGIPQDFDWRNAKSLGLRLVISLVEQLSGTIELDRRAGTTFTIVVKEKE